MAYSDDHCIFQNNFHNLLFLQPTIGILRLTVNPIGTLQIVLIIKCTKM